MTDLPRSILEAAAALRDGSLTSAELTAAVLARADAYDGVLGTYLARFDETALAAAAQADQDLASGVDRGPLQGIPLGIKDIIATAEGPTTANSVVFDRAWGAGSDAPVVARLRAAGAVITGKVTTMEFAIGVPDPDKPFPVPRNPWDLDTWAGGSSSGTGNGVAAGLFLGGLGTDTGGSIRLPSAFCGITGLMPTFGRVPKSGCIPLGYSLDHIGPMARTAADCAALLQALAGYHPSDPYSSRRLVPDYLAGLSPDALSPGAPFDGGGLRGLRVGVDRVNHQASWADPAVAKCLEDALVAFEALGATVTEVELPYYDDLTAVSLITMAAEALAYHLPDLRSRWGDYARGTRNLVALGALASGADLVQADRVRRLALGALHKLFADVDVVVAPTASAGATRVDHLGGGGLMEGFRSIHTMYWDPAGNPVMAVPMGFTDGGLPLSMQIAGRPFEEATVLAAGHRYQQHTGWHAQLPPAPDPSAPRAQLPAAAPAPRAPADEGAVRVLLGAAGLEPAADEIAGFVEAYPTLRGLLDRLHEVPGVVEAPRALAFDPTPDLTPWP